MLNSTKYVAEIWPTKRAMLNFTSINPRKVDSFTLEAKGRIYRLFHRLDGKASCQEEDTDWLPSRYEQEKAKPTPY